MTYFDHVYNHPLATKAHRDILVYRERPEYAGSFMQALCTALFKSDLENRARIRQGFPELVAAYDDWFHGRGPFEDTVSKRPVSSLN